MVSYLCVCEVRTLHVMCFFFKQKTAYEVRISDWSSDVCSSDLLPLHVEWARDQFGRAARWRIVAQQRIVHREIDRIEPESVDAVIEPEPRHLEQRSAERRVGKECVSKGRSRGSPFQ